MTLAAVPPTRDGERDQSERSTSLGKITTRPSVAEDSAFMLELYASTSKDVLDDLGWSIGGQRTFVIMQAQAEEWNRARLYPGMDRLTICVDEMPVGRLLVCLRNNILHMVDLSLLPRFRGLGIGTQLMGEIIEEARNARVPVKVRVRKDSSGVRFVERLGFSTPTDLGAFVELTWMPPLAALGPDDRDDGFTSHGTRSNRATPIDDLDATSTDTPDEMPDGMVSIETARVAELQAEEIVAGVAAEAAAAADAAEAAEALRTRDAAEPEAPVDLVVDVAAETDADAVIADDDDPTDETDESAEPVDDVHLDVNQAVQQYVAQTDAEYLAEPVWLAPEVVVEDEEDVVEEEEEEEVVEEDPEVAARNAEFLESVTATDAFTSTFTAYFSAEVVEDVIEEEEILPFGADRYDPFA